VPGTREIIFPPITTAVTPAEAAELGRLARDATVLELGSFFGFSTIVMASVADLVYSVDCHEGDDHAGDYHTWNDFRANVQGYGVKDHVVAIKGRFEEEVPRLHREGIRVDGAFLDGQHDAVSVRRDLDLALLLVKPGGWVAFHDYGRGPETGHPGFEVTKVADEFGVTEVVGCLAWGIHELVPGFRLHTDDMTHFPGEGM
jgi:predicted O-methyltransferase YrrM